MLNRLNGATRECLEHCYQSDSWLASLAEYAEWLRADGWSEEEIDEVEATVWRILRAMARSDATHDAEQSSATPGADVASAST